MQTYNFEPNHGSRKIPILRSTRELIRKGSLALYKINIQSLFQFYPYTNNVLEITLCLLQD